jgi:antitoxin ParD1/3/4
VVARATLADSLAPFYRSAMTRRTVTLPEPLDRFVDAQVASGGYASADEYLRELVRRDRDRLELRALLLAGPASGPGTPADEAWFAHLRDAIRSGAA